MAAASGGTDGFRADVAGILEGVAILAREGRLAFWGYLLCTLWRGVTPAVIAGALGVVVTYARGGPAAHALPPSVLAAVAVICAMILIGEVAAACEDYTRHLTSLRFSTALNARLMTALSTLPGLAHVEDPRTRDLLHLASAGAAAPDAFVTYISGVWAWGATVAGCALIAAQLGWWVPVLIVLAGVPAMVASWRDAVVRTGAQVSRGADLRRADYHYALAQDRAAGMEARIFGIGPWLLERQARFWRLGMQGVFAGARRELAQGVALLALQLVTGASALAWALVLATRGELGPGRFASIALAVTTLLAALVALQQFPGLVRAAGSFLPAVFALCALETQDEAPSPAAPRRRLPSVLRSGIVFDDVYFTYPGRTEPVLRGLHLHIPAGQSLALVGKNSAGKSTIVKLLCRFYDPDRGRILWDGVDVRDVDIHELRARVAAVFQDFVRYPGTLADNIGIGCIERWTDRAVIEEAAELAGMAAVVPRLPRGWDTLLVPDLGGVDLSGGQWQRVAIARAMAARLGRGADMVVVDEPTVALDVRAEAELNRRWLDLTRGATTLLVSHRLTTVRNAHMIAVLEDGVIVEQGSHEALLGQDGLYALWYKLQTARLGLEEE